MAAKQKLLAAVCITTRFRYRSLQGVEVPNAVIEKHPSTLGVAREQTIHNLRANWFDADVIRKNRHLRRKDRATSRTGSA